MPAVSSSPCSNLSGKGGNKMVATFLGLLLHVFYRPDFEQHLSSSGEAEWKMAAAEGWDFCPL